MSTIRRWKQSAIEAALAEGAEKAVIEDRQGKHLRLHITRNGTTRVVAMARTPSDFRSIPNLRRDVRRVMRAMGRR